MLGNFGVFSFLRSWKLTRFLTTCISATSFKIWTFSAFFVCLKRLERSFLKSLHTIFIMYIIRSETFIKIDSLQHLKTSRKTYILRTGQKSALQHSLFWRYANFSKIMPTINIPPWLVHFSLNLSHLLNVKHWQYSHWNVLVMDICILRINLEKLA